MVKKRCLIKHLLRNTDNIFYYSIKLFNTYSKASSDFISISGVTPTLSKLILEIYDNCQDLTTCLKPKTLSILVLRVFFNFHKIALAKAKMKTFIYKIYVASQYYSPCNHTFFSNNCSSVSSLFSSIIQQSTGQTEAH